MMAHNAICKKVSVFGSVPKPNAQLMLSHNYGLIKIVLQFSHYFWLI